MQIAYAYLARWAEANPDNTVTLMGGDFEIIRAERFPAAFPVSVILKLTGMREGDEAPNLGMRLTLDITGPENVRVFNAPLLLDMSGRHIPDKVAATHKGVARVVVNLGLVPFVSPGAYEIRITINTSGDQTAEAKTIIPLVAELKGD